MNSRRKTISFGRGFALVELLVVIGIIAVLISILLPALSKARDQANTIVCQSNERQFYQCCMLYAADYRGAMLPARFQMGPPVTTNSAEYDWFEPMFLGSELAKAKGAFDSGSGTARAFDTTGTIKLCLTCPAADHSTDPSPDAVIAAGKSIYYGDYIYNTFMGSFQWTNGTGPNLTASLPYLKVSQIPSNVIIMMESVKPNVIGGVVATLATGAYKPYYQKNTEIWTTDPSKGSGPTSTLINLRIGTPHRKNKLMNVLCADGHIATVDPYKDFFTNPADQTTVKDFMWNAKDDLSKTPPVTGHPGWKKGLPGV